MALKNKQDVLQSTTIGVSKELRKKLRLVAAMLDKSYEETLWEALDMLEKEQQKKM